MKVQFLNEHDEVLLTVTLNDRGEAVWNDDIMTLDGEVIFDVRTGERIYPSQGIRFMKALPDNYRSAYLRAELMENDQNSCLNSLGSSQQKT